MKFISSQLIVSSCCLISFGLVGCDPSMEVTPIAQLSAQSDRLEQSVLVEGVVRDRAPFLKNAAYQLQDDSGNIWVFTNNQLPESGQAVTIKAIIKAKSIVINNQEVQEVYLQEETLTSVNN
ncbi:MAG: DNA-binding protein [Halothece sp.]